MKKLAALLVFALLVAALSAQTPQTRYSYDDKSGTTGHTLVIDGKSFGPYKDISSPYFSQSGTAVGFTVTKRDKTYVVAGGTEFGPIAPDYDPGTLTISDDGKLWSLTATKSTDSEDDTTYQSLLYVNGKSYGPYDDVYSFEYAEKGGNWIAMVKSGEDEEKAVVKGKESAPFNTVDHIWVSLDGTQWGYVASDSDGNYTVVTQDKTWQNAEDTNFEMMNPKDPHWAYAIRQDEDHLLIVVDGKTYTGYTNFGGLVVSPSGKGWGFTADKMADAGDTPMVVINGKEYLGEGLFASRSGAQESFYWTIQDGSKMALQALQVGP